MSLSYPLSFQLYSSREFPPFDAQFAALAGLGYTNVEVFGPLYADPKSLRASLDTNGLTALSGHFDMSLLLSDPDKVIEIAKIVGIEIIVAPWIDVADRPTDAAGWKALGARLAKLQKTFAAAGLGFAWHNHDFEFRQLPDGSFPIDHILGGNSVDLEIDVAWIVRAGVEPGPWIEKFSDRIAVVHVKDVAAEGQNAEQDGWADLGQGIVDWRGLWPAIKQSGTRLAILEHDRPGDWLRFARNSGAAYRALAEQ